MKVLLTNDVIEFNFYIEKDVLLELIRNDILEMIPKDKEKKFYNIKK